MLIWTLFTACQSDRYLNHPVYQETESGMLLPVEPVCDGPMINVAPTTLSFFVILSPFPEDIDLRTDSDSVAITNNCDTDLNIYVFATAGKVGQFSAIRQNSDHDGAGSGEYQFVIPAFETHIRTIAYAADNRAALAEYDHGTFDAYVVTDDALGFHASASLEATVINVLLAE